MSIAFLMVFLGLVLLIAGYKNVSVSAALRGNFEVAKPDAGSTK